MSSHIVYRYSHCIGSYCVQAQSFRLRLDFLQSVSVKSTSRHKNLETFKSSMFHGLGFDLLHLHPHPFLSFPPILFLTYSIGLSCDHMHQTDSLSSLPSQCIPIDIILKSPYQPPHPPTPPPPHPPGNVPSRSNIRMVWRSSSSCAACPSATSPPLSPA